VAGVAIGTATLAPMISVAAGLQLVDDVDDALDPVGILDGAQASPGETNNLVCCRSVPQSDVGPPASSALPGSVDRLPLPLVRSTLGSAGIQLRLRQAKG